MINLGIAIVGVAVIAAAVGVLRLFGIRLSITRA
jgi:hypothetical protein